jgi:hypothetical protein
LAIICLHPLRPEHHDYSRNNNCPPNRAVRE